MTPTPAPGKRRVHGCGRHWTIPRRNFTMPYREFETRSRRGQGRERPRNQMAILHLEIVSIYSNNQGGCRADRGM